MMKSVRGLLAALLLIGASVPVGAQTIAGGSVAAQAGFGGALAVGNHGELLVGESENETKPGAVYVYRKVNGNWNEVAAITGSGAEAGDGFGRAIAVSGDLMLVSAGRGRVPGGTAYVFQRDARGGWHEVAKLTSPEPASGGFGSEIALSNGLAVIGAPLTAKRAGAVYVYRRNGNNWSHEVTLVSPEAKEQLLFGAGVAIHGSSILVGEPGYNERTGTVHVFTRAGAEWQASSKLTANGLQKNDHYGAPIVAGAERVLVGATGFASASGAVFSFIPDAQSGWKEAGRLLAYDGRTADQFGSAIAFDGDNYFIGAPRANGMRGAAYHIWRSAADSTLTGAERLSAGELEGRAFFGGALATRGNVAAASIANADFGLGAVAIYEFDGEKWSLATMLRGTDERLPSIATGRKACTNGKAAQFDCKDVELLSYLSVPDIGGGRGVQLNDIWGWTDPQTGKEWALVGRMDGTSFVDISNPEKPVYVANLPLTKGANPATWRDIKVYRDHAYIVADGAGAHGMQVFDLTRLRNARQAPVTLEPDYTYRRINSSHNIVINEETGFAYAAGASSGGETCGGGLHMISLKDPKQPQFAGCFADPQTGRANTGYSHDAQCVVYRGPDEQYKGREICLGSNETMLSIADVTDKQNPKAISRASYPNAGYSHQGWLDEEHRYFYMDDELDELAGTTPRTRTIIWDLTDLDDPQVATMFLSPTAASDHNLFIKGDTMYQSHYLSGVRIVDITNREAPVEVGYFDTVPYGENKPGFGGSWSNYPFFKSGAIIATSMNEGLFVLKKKEPKPVL
ncbi:MAG: choice-of-anchor B family protein [Gemmatimonadota bacterium]